MARQETPPHLQDEEAQTKSKGLVGRSNSDGTHVVVLGLA